MKDKSARESITQYIEALWKAVNITQNDTDWEYILKIRLKKRIIIAFHTTQAFKSFGYSFSLFILYYGVLLDRIRSDL